MVRGGAGIYRFHDSVTDVTSEFAEAENVRYTDLQGFGDNTLEGVNTLNLNPNTYGNTGLGSTETYISPATIYGLDPNDNKEPVTNNYSLSIAHADARQLDSSGFVRGQQQQLADGQRHNASRGSEQHQCHSGGNAVHTASGGGHRCAGTATTPATPRAAHPSGRKTRQHLQLPGRQGHSECAALSRITARSWCRNTTPTPTTTASRLEAIKRAGPLNFNVNYSFSKALGILGSSADFNWTAGIDPFHLSNNYGPMNFDRTQVLNLSYSYQTGKLTDAAHGLLNHWLISGITNFQSGANMQTGVSPSPSYYLQGNIGTGANAYPIESQSILGTPDVNLQPVLTCNPESNLAAHQYLNPSCFALPALGTNGRYIEPYAHGPAFFNSDLTLEKRLRPGRGPRPAFPHSRIQLPQSPAEQLRHRLCVADHAAVERRNPGTPPRTIPCPPSALLLSRWAGA